MCLYQPLNPLASTFAKSVAAISAPFAMAFLLLSQLAGFQRS
jgi:hypothetical protein